MLLVQKTLFKGPLYEYSCNNLNDLTYENMV